MVRVHGIISMLILICTEFYDRHIFNHQRVDYVYTRAEVLLFMKYSIIQRVLIAGAIAAMFGGIYLFLNSKDDGTISTRQNTNQNGLSSRSLDAVGTPAVITFSPESNTPNELTMRQQRTIVDFEAFKNALMNSGSLTEQRYVISNWAPSLVSSIGGTRSFEKIQASFDGEIANFAMSCVVRAVLKNGQIDEATRLLTRMPPSGDRLSGVSNVAEKIISIDMAGARKLYSELFDNEKTAAISGFRTAMSSKRDIGGLRDLLEFDCPLAEKQATVRAAIAILSREHNGAGIEGFIASIPSEYQPYAIESQFATRKFSNFSQAVPIILGIPDDASRARIIASRVSSFAQISPKETAEGITKLPESLQLNAIKSLAYQWSKTNPNGLSEWISNLPAGANKDAAIRIFCEGIRRADPEAAIESAKALSNPVLRDEVLKSLAH